MLSARGLQQNIGTTLSALYCDTRAVFETLAFSLRILVLAWREYFKVFRPVVALIAVLVMNVLSPLKAPPNLLFSNQSVFQDIAVLASIRVVRALQHYIAFFAKHAPTVPSSILRANMLRLGVNFRSSFVFALMAGNISLRTTSLNLGRGKSRMLHNLTTATPAGS